MTANDGVDIEFSNLSDKSIAANNEQTKFTEFFLEGSFQDSNLEIVKQRIKAICDNVDPEEYAENESQYILGDPLQITGLTSFKPTVGKGKGKGRTSHSNKDDRDTSLDTINPSPMPVQSPMSVGSIGPGGYHPSTGTPHTPQSGANLGGTSGPGSVGVSGPGSSGPGAAGFGSFPGNMTTGLPFKPVAIWITNFINQNKPHQVKYYGKLLEKGSTDPTFTSNKNRKTGKQVLIRPVVISNCSPSTGVTHGIFRLLKDCWDFKLTADFICKGFQYCKQEVDYKRNITWLIKVRIFKIYQKVPDPSNDGKIIIDKQTSSYLVNASLISPYSGNKEMMAASASILKNFCEQLKPLVNLEKIY